MATFVKFKGKGYNTGLDSKVAGNSLAVENGDALTLTGGFIVKATAGSTIIGVSADNGTFAANNQTVAKDKVLFSPVSTEETFIIPITGGTITQAKVGNFYDINAGQVVNGASESATTGTLRLERFISATSGEFSIVNL